MIEPKHLSEAFARNLYVIKLQTDGLTHEDSLLQPPFRGNCLNWVLGHIAATRSNVVSQILGGQPVLSEADMNRYERDSEPVTSGEDNDIIPLERLLDALEHTQEGIAAGLERLTPDDMAKEAEIDGRPATLEERLFILYFHETYHTGQTELLRQLADKSDKVI